MRIWLDAQLSPVLARWIAEMFSVEAYAVQGDPEMVSAKDAEIFSAAREAGAIVMTKDRDFIDLLERHGPPPQVIWITCGNTSNRAMRHILSSSLPAALDLIGRGESLIEIGDAK
jgi:predicted nuclease of predicted toxin-antitoxin system